MARIRECWPVHCSCTTLVTAFAYSARLEWRSRHAVLVTPHTMPPALVNAEASVCDVSELPVGTDVLDGGGSLTRQLGRHLDAKSAVDVDPDGRIFRIAI